MSKKKEYLVQVTIIEGRNMRVKESNVDPFVKISVANQNPQVTTVANGAAQATWNQSFTFKNLELSDVDLENFEILIEVLDFNQFSSNKMIGAYSIGLGTLYRSMNHEICAKWLTLSNPALGKEPTGYLLISCYIIAPGDAPPIHGINDMQNLEDEGDEFEGLADDDLTPEQRKARNDKRKNLEVLSKPEVMARGYQLQINVAKAEGLPKLSVGAVDTFVSVRSVGSVQTTSVVRNTQTPTYNCRFMFPVFMPVFNDKIILRIWDKSSVGADLFLANVPEVPGESDFFNINSLQAKGSFMPYRWINLYGIAPEERGNELVKFFFGKNKTMEGTQWFGRLLVGMNLSQNEKPTKGKQALPSYREPQVRDYMLRVDVYEVQEAMECGSEIQIKASIGPYTAESEKVGRAYRTENGDRQEIKGNYVWKEKKVKIEDIKQKFPADTSQVPDIFISLYTSGVFGGERRVGYLRVPVTESSIYTANPKWYQLRSIENQLDTTPSAYLLANIQLKADPKGASARIPKRRDIKSKYYFICYLYGGYDLAPELYIDEVQPQIEVKIPPMKPFKPKKNDHKGKHPIWNEFLHKEMELDDNLEFAPNILVNVTNGGKTKIGDFSIAAPDCRVIKNIVDLYADDAPKPQLYTLMNNAEPQGRILASFTMLKNPKKTFKFEPKKFRTFNKIKCDIELSFIGIRNLEPAFKDPQLRLRIAGVEEPQLVTMDKEKGLGDRASYSNPNFIQIATFKDVELPEDPLYIPPVEIELIEGGENFGTKFMNVFTGQTKFFCFVPLLERTNWVSSKEVMSTMNTFGRSKPKAAGGPAIPGATPGGPADKSQLTLKNLKNLDGDKKKGPQDITTNKQDLYADTGEGIDFEEIQERLAIEEKKAGKKQKMGGDEDSDDDFDRVEQMNFRFDDLEIIDATASDKTEEKKERKEKINELEAEYLIKKKDPKADPMDLKLLREQREVVQNEFIMDYGKFTGKGDNAFEEYSYGFDRIKGTVEGEKMIDLPYERFELYKIVRFSKNMTDNNGIAISGMPSGAILKGLVRAVKKEGVGNDRLTVTTKKSKAMSVCSAVFRNIDTDPLFPFDIFQKHILDSFFSPPSIKSRIYLYRAIHLAAQEDKTEFLNNVAGMSSLCSADTYPMIKVGEGNAGGEDVTKIISDKINVVMQNLDPGYFKMFELDVTLPEDWRLEIKVMNQKTLMDQMIGMTTIDLEDRFYGDKTSKQRLAYECHQKFHDDQFKHWQNEPSGPKKEEMVKMHKEKRNVLNIKIAETQDTKFKGYAEYRALTAVGQNASQGSLEMAVETIQADLTRLQPPTKIEQPKPKIYEIRIVLYETFEVPFAPGNSTVNIYIKCMFDPEGWSVEEIVKETDCHNGSTNGWGVFNWRMKFALQIPCQFPRLRFCVMDRNTLGSDDTIGECVISIRRLIKKIKAEGRYEKFSTEIDLTHANYPKKNRGRLKLGIKIIPKEEADARPVGEAQEDPNEDPWLEKPKVGRGIGDFLKGGWSLPDFGIIKRILMYIVGLVLGMLLIIILFIKPGLLTK
jgi:hypothetical protein